MSKLKFEKVTYYEVNYNDLNQLINKIYNVNYEFVANQEANNDNCYRFLAEAEELEDTESVSDAQPYEILNDLAFKKLIPEGNYLILVRW